MPTVRIHPVTLQINPQTTNAYFTAPAGSREVYDTAGDGTLHSVSFSESADEPGKYFPHFLPAGQLYVRVET